MEKQLKPQGVPENAIWNPKAEKWQLGTSNSENKPIGEWKWWRPETGIIAYILIHDDNGVAKSFTSFHPNGEIACEGTYLKNTVNKATHYRSTESTDVRFAFGTEGSEVWKAVQRSGFPLTYDYYDKDGRHLNSEIKQSALPVGNQMTKPSKSDIDTLQRKGKRLRDIALDGSALETILGKISPLLSYEDDLEDAIQPLLEVIIDDLNEDPDAGDILVVNEGIHLSELNTLSFLGLKGVIVWGDLTIDGTMRLSENHLLVVSGNLVAQNVITSGNLIVLGKMIAKSCILGDYNHGSAFIEGGMEAKFFYPEEYEFKVTNENNFKYAFGKYDGLSLNDQPLSDFIQLIHPLILENMDQNKAYYDTPCKEGRFWDYVDRWQFMRYVEQGKPVFKE